MIDPKLNDLSLEEFFDNLGELPFFHDLNFNSRIKSIGLFRTLPEEKLLEIASELKFRHYHSDSIISREGDYDHSVYIVLSGTVEVAYSSNDKKVQFGPGVFFGESGALSGNPRNANLIARTDCLLLQIPRHTFLDLYGSHGEFKNFVNKFYIERALQAHLRSLEIFAGLTEQQFTFLIQRAQLHRFQEGDIIVNQGDDGDSLYLVRTGFVRISRNKDDGREVVITYMKEGNYFGEMAMVTGETRTANVVAESLVECIEIKGQDFNKLVESEPELKTQIHQVVEHRLEEQKKKLAEDNKESEERLNIFKDLIQSDEVLVIDRNYCIRCNNCVTACESTHGVARMSLSGDVIDDYIITSSCRHCANPKCLKCNYDAIERDRDGEVFFKDNCIGCGDCAKNCPYGMISMVNSSGDASFNIFEAIQFWKPKVEEEPQKNKRQPVKCNLCRELPYQSCVSNCPTTAMKFVAVKDMVAEGNEIQ